MTPACSGLGCGAGLSSASSTTVESHRACDSVDAPDSESLARHPPHSVRHGRPACFGNFWSLGEGICDGAGHRCVHPAASSAGARSEAPRNSRGLGGSSVRSSALKSPATSRGPRWSRCRGRWRRHTLQMNDVSRAAIPRCKPSVLSGWACAGCAPSRD